MLVLLPELTAEEVFGAETPFASLLSRAAVGVMNPAVRGPREAASAYLTLGAGERVAAGPLREPARFPEEPLESDTARVVYERRVGPLRAAPAAGGEPGLLHPGWGAYLHGLDARLPAGVRQAAGGLGEALRGRGGVAWLGVGAAGRSRAGALTALDSAGTVPLAAVAADLSPAEVRRLLARAALVVVDLPPGADPGEVARFLAALSRRPDLDILLVSPYPPRSVGGGWDSLTPVLALGPDFPPGVLTSSTTRTPGLIANIDVAPTLVAALGLPPPATMRGRVIRSVPPADAARVLRFAREAQVAHHAVVPLGIGAGVVAVAALVLALLALTSLRRERASMRPGETAPGALPPGTQGLVSLARAAVLLTSALPLGLLLAPLRGGESIARLAASMAFFTTAAALAAGVAPGLRTRPLPSLFLLTVVVLAVDVARGCPWVARSPLSGYAVAGIRFYGLGNEFMGVLVGSAVLASLAFEERLARYRSLQAVLFLALLLLIGLPRMGADFGGGLTAAAAFTTALLLAIRPGRLLLTGAAVVAAVLLTGVGLALWDARQPEGVRTHTGDFARSVMQGGWAAAAPVVQGKAAMGVRLLTSGYALAAIVGVAPLVGLWYYGAGRWLCALLGRRSALRAAIGGGVVGSWAALLLNDSGISSWMFITAAVLAMLLDEQLRSPP